MTESLNLQKKRKQNKKYQISICHWVTKKSHLTLVRILIELLLQDNVALQIFSIYCGDFANFLNKTPVGTIVSQVIIFVNVSNVSFGLQGGAGGDKYWKCQGVIVFCSLTLNVYVNSQETAVLSSFNWMCNHFWLHDFTYEVWKK